jgi:agmatine/peptidylarginine deiminase
MRVFMTFSFLVFTLSMFGQPVNPFTPPEYHPTEAVLMEWELDGYTWPVYRDLIAACITEAEVILVVNDAAEEAIALGYLNAENIPLEHISFAHVPSGRMWIRDHGPFAIMTDTGREFCDFGSFANQYPSELLPTSLGGFFNVPVHNLNGIILDGGNLMVDSHGTLFCTDRLYTNNPSLSQTYINQALQTYMGINEVVTVQQQHNDYWGHIDMQIKLLNDTTLVVSSVTPGYEPQYSILESNYALLSGLTAPNGNPYHIERLPMAQNWKTYANSLILNDKVIVPVYNHANDQLALNTYQQLLPDKQVVGVNADLIIGWEGALHCITMQLFDPNPPASCLGDFDNDGLITAADLLVMLAEFGCSETCNADVDGDGVVGAADILLMLSLYGSDCPD